MIYKNDVLVLEIDRLWNIKNKKFYNKMIWKILKL